MSDIEEEHLDTDSAQPGTPPPATAERKRPARAMIAVLVVLAIATAIVIMTLIPNGAVTQ